MVIRNGPMGGKVGGNAPYRCVECMSLNVCGLRVAMQRTRSEAKAYILPLSAYAENKMAAFTSGKQKLPRRLFFRGSNAFAASLDKCRRLKDVYADESLSLR